MENILYDYSAIVNRPAIHWPGGKRVAFYVAVNVEYYLVDKPSTSIFPGTSDLIPDPLNFGWRDYGLRVGIWRMMQALDTNGIRASVMLNSDVCAARPQVLSAGRERGWCWVAHGRNNSTLSSHMNQDEEKRYLADVVETLERSTGTRPKGWLGPALTETFNTPALLAELGLWYVLDWACDDQPFRLKVPGMISVPYSIELNDVVLFGAAGYTGEQFVQLVQDEYAQLHHDSADSGRVMALCLHPFVIGQPFRHRYLEEVLEFITAQEDVWLTTSDEIAAHYRTAVRVES